MKNVRDLEKIELIVLFLLAFLILFFGFYPEPLFNTIDISVNNSENPIWPEFLNDYD